MKTLCNSTLLITLLLASFKLAYAQVVIYKTDNEKIYCNSYEIRHNSIIYKVGKSKNTQMESLDNIYRVVKNNENKSYTYEVTNKVYAESGSIAFTVGRNQQDELYIYDAVMPAVLTNSGAQINDIITHVDGIPVKYVNKVYGEWEYGHKKDYIDVTLLRGQKTIKARFYYYDYEIDYKDEDQIKLISYQEETSTTPKSSNSKKSGLGYYYEPDYHGFNVSFIYGVGCSSFKGKSPLKFVYEFEIGYTSPRTNFSNNFKFGIHEYRKHNNEKMYAFNYRFLQYFGQHHRSGFNIGLDIGAIYVPNSNGFFWQPGLVMGYDFRIYRHIRLGLIGEVYLLPTYRFSNLAVGGYGGIKITGLL